MNKFDPHLVPPRSGAGLPPHGPGTKNLINVIPPPLKPGPPGPQPPPIHQYHPMDSHHPMGPNHFGPPGPFEHSGPCHAFGYDDFYYLHDIYGFGVPNPSMTHYRHHIHPPHPPRPHDEIYVTKRELNEILRHLSEANIFIDKSLDGTTCSVGGITKGTTFRNKLVFTEFIEKLLYPEEGSDAAYITQAELEEALENIDYSILKNIPETFDYKYPCKDEEGIKLLNYIVVNQLGGFKVGDSLEGMTMSEIIEKLLCGGSDPWGRYIWKSNMYDLPSGTFEIDASEFCPYLLADIASDEEGLEHWFDTKLFNGSYELYAVVPTIDKADSGYYKYDCIVACSNTDNSENPQITNPSWADVPSSLSWTFNSDTNKIILSGSGITTNMTIIMISRK